MSGKPRHFCTLRALVRIESRQLAAVSSKYSPYFVQYLTGPQFFVDFQLLIVETVLLFPNCVEIEKKDLRDAVQLIYKAYPDLLNAAKKILFG